MGMPARSSSLTSAAPLRVPVPQVEGETTAWTPLATSSAAISRPNFFEFSIDVPFPVVT